MSKEEMFEAMQEIEFVLFSLKSKSNLHPGEIEEEHKKAQELLKQLYIDKNSTMRV